MRTRKLDIVINYRSPFCALAIERLFALPRRYKIEVQWRIVREVPRPSSLPVTENNPRFAYNRQDCKRRAQWLGLAWNPPQWRLSDVVEASRIGQRLLASGSPLFETYSTRILRAYWQEQHNISDPEVVRRLAREVGVSEADLKSAASSETDSQLDENTRWCEHNSVLGAPFVLIDQERFWGSDRVEAVERYLAEGGHGPLPAVLEDGILFLNQPVPTIPVTQHEAKVAVGRIFCVGRNYHEHAREMGVDSTREAPFFFMKPADSLVLSDAHVPYPPETHNFHYEMELVVVLGKPLFRASVESASSAIFGYAAGLDMTRRDLQLAAREKGRPWELGKSFDSGAIIGPIRAASDLEGTPLGRLTLDVNGTIKQKALLADMIWSVPEIIANLSQYYELRPGDVIFTGTPSGVGPVVPGDQLLGEIEGIGGVRASIGPPRI